MEEIRTAELMMDKYRTDGPHVRHVAGLADGLFLKLKSLHGLEESHRVGLKLAAYLHDIGHYVGEKHHHRHSCYLILTDELLQGWEPELRSTVAYAALNHRKKRRLEWEGAGEGDRKAADSITAILRIADVLDRSHEQKTKLKDVRHIPEERLVVIELEGMELAASAKKLNKKLRWAAVCWGVDFVLSNGKEKVAVLLN